MLIDTRTKTIEYVNAGHPPGFLFEEGKAPVALNQGSCAVGFFDQMEITKSIFTYEQPIRIALYTDGLLEALPLPEDYPEDAAESDLLALRLQSCIHQVPSPECLVETLLPQDVREAQSDDICMVLITAT